MKSLTTWFRPFSARLFALCAVGILYHAAQLPILPAGERREMAARFHFVATPLPQLPGKTETVRSTAPSLRQIDGWISAVGAAAALYDLDGDGLPNDVCYVDTRTNQVIVAPVPGTGDRYRPFLLNPAPLLYDTSTMAPMGCQPGHMTEGALADVLVYYWGRSPVAFLRKSQEPLGADAFVPVEIVPDHPRWYTNAAVFADLTGSGHADLVIANYFQDGARILDAAASGSETMQHGMPRAYNGGGKHFLRWSGASAGPDPSVTFNEVQVDLDPEVSAGWTLALGAADLNGDQLPELYFANDFGPDRLLLNRSTPNKLRFVLMHGAKDLTTPNSKVLGRDSFKGMGVDFGDIDGTGRLAIFVSNITEPYALEESNFLWVANDRAWDEKRQLAPYADRAEQRGVARSGWAWDAKLADFDNSGRLEIVQAMGFLQGKVNRWPELQELAMANDELLSNPRVWPRLRAGDAISDHDHNAFFVQSQDGTYFDLARDIGLEPVDRDYVSRGIAVADVDGSGRLSFVVANQWAPSTFYRNEGPTKNAFLGLHLRYPVGKATSVEVTPGHPSTAGPSRPAIGATIFVTLPGGKRMEAQVDGGNGHSGKRSPDLHFGLGPLPATAPVKVEIRWRNGGEQLQRTMLTLTPGWYTVRLGAGNSAQGVE